MLDNDLEDELFGNRIKEDESSFVTTQYICHNCDASFCTSMHTKVDNCIICGKPSLTMDDFVEARHMKYIPFKKTMKDAERVFFKKTFWNPLVPFSFKLPKVRRQINKVYLPAYLADVNHSGTVIFMGGDKENIIKNNKKCVELKKYEINHSINIDYKNMLLGVFSNINDKVFSSICTYEYNNLKDFDSKAINDSFYLLGNRTIADVGENGRNKVLRHSFSIVRGNIKHSLKKMSDDSTTISFQNTTEVLVPVYVLTIQYRKKNYTFMMNGENEKNYMELPIGILSTCVFTIFITAIIFYIVYLIACYY